MMTRRAALLSALLFTAALLYVAPGLYGMLGARDRTDARLRPAKARTLTVWLLSNTVDDRSTLGAMMTEFERAREGVRVYLRRVDARELLDADVKPDVALYATGDVLEPEKIFLPLASLPGGGHSAGMSGGVCYAAPLWYEPGVLSLPYSWLREEEAPPKTESYFKLETPAPRAELSPIVAKDDLPWRELLAPGRLERPEGVALQQILMTCPTTLRPELIAALGGETAPDSNAALGTNRLAVSAQAGAEESARVVTLREALRQSDRLYHVLAPAASQRVRFASLCRDGEDARALLRFLMEAGDAALGDGLMPLSVPDETADALRQAACTLCREGALLPNAFAHTPEELRSLCLDAFLRGEDPARTLLSLR